MRFLLFFFCCISLALNAQKEAPQAMITTGMQPYNFSMSEPVPNQKCMYDELRFKQMQDPAYRQQMAQFEKLIQKRIKANREAAREGEKATLYTIPIVFHIYHVGEAVGVGHNIPDAQIYSAVDALNRDFRRLADDGGIAQGAGPDIEIEFCLATTDPQGNPHSGINRVDASGTANYDTQGIDEDVNGLELKALSKWPTADYVNIWIVREINDQGEFGEWNGGTLGYAYPVSSSSNTNPGNNPSFNPGDGIVVVNFSLGNDPDRSEGWMMYSNTKLNRTLTHEMGHHFNLQHPFVANTCSETDCSTEGDFVCDTPPTVLNSNCNSPACSGTQLVENYMDYTGESCANMFTQGQKDRMRAVLEGFSRNSLTSSVGCSSTFARADFSADKTTAGIGENIVFTDDSDGSPALNSWAWDFGDGNTSTQQNPTHSYASGGFYTVSLTVGNGSETDVETKVDYIFIEEEAAGTIGGECDTLRNYTAAEFENITTYTSGGDPVPGIGGSNFQGFAERFENSGTYVFQSFQFAVQRTNDQGAASNVTFNVYDDAGNGPGSVIASGAVPLANLAEQSYNLISFPNPIEVTGNFYVGWEFSATTDTMAVFATQFRDNGYNSLFLKQNNQWFVFSDPAKFSMIMDIIPYKELELEIDLVAGEGDHCEGDELQFGVVNDLNHGQYAWTLESGVNSADASPTHTFSNTGLNTVNLTVTGRCGSSEQDSYSVFTYEAIDVSASIVDSDCGSQNGSIKIINNGSAQLSYDWQGFSNTTDSVGDLAPGNYTVEITNGPCVESLTYTVGENSASNLGLTFYAENPTCGEENGIIAVIPDRAGNFEYFWNGSQTPQSDTLFDQAPGLYSVIVKENGCVAGTDQYDLVNQGSIPDVSASVVDSDCGLQNGSIKLTNNGSGQLTYDWQGLSNQTDSVGDLAPGSYTVIVSDGICSATLTYSVGETTPSVAMDFFKEDPRCEEENGVVAAVMARNGNFEFFWNGNANAGQNDTLFNQAPGAYAVVVKENGCTVAGEQTTLVNVGQLPNVSFTLADTLDLGSNYTIQSGAAGSGDHLYKFSDGQANQSVENPSVTFNNLGDVSVTLVITTDEGCIDSLTQTVHIRQTVGIQNSYFESLLLYPNPASNYLILQYDASALSIERLMIYDITGKLILENEIVSNKERINLSQLSKGTYHVMLYSNKGSVARSLVVVD